MTANVSLTDQKHRANAKSGSSGAPDAPKWAGVARLIKSRHKNPQTVLLGRKSATGNELRKSRATGASLELHPGQFADSPIFDWQPIKLTDISKQNANALLRSCYAKLEAVSPLMCRRPEAGHTLDDIETSSLQCFGAHVMMSLPSDLHQSQVVKTFCYSLYLNWA